LPTRRSSDLRELLDDGLHGQLELVDELVGEILIPVREEHACRAERDPRVRLIGVLLALAHEAHAAEHAGVLVGVLAEDADGSARREVLRREDRHGRGLSRAVAAEEAVDRVALDVEAHAVEGVGVLVGLREITDLDDGVHTVLLGRRDQGEGVACSEMSWATSSGVRPSLRASSMRGATCALAKAARRSASSCSRAPGETNMPMPRRLYSTPFSTSMFTPFAAVAGLRREKDAISFVEGAFSSSAR